MEAVRISNRIKAMAPSATLAMSQKSSELRAAGVDVINLSVGEPDFDTPPTHQGCRKKGYRRQYHPISAGARIPLPSARPLPKKLHKENGLDYTPEQIVVSAGAKHSLYNAILAMVNPGDEVVIPMPAWVSYVEMVKLAEGTVVPVEAGIDQNFKVTPAQLEAAITPRTSMVLLCSPSNPSGSVYSREELRGLVDVLARHPHVAVLSDEIYEHINYTGSFTSLGSFPEIADRVVIVNGVSKAYAMTGWRIGFIAAPVAMTKAVTKLQGQTTSGISTIAQMAALGAYTGPQQCVEDMRIAFERRRDLVVRLAAEIPGLKANKPDGAFYLFPEVSAFLGKTAPDGRVIATDNDLCLYLLEVAHVATVPGSAFCLPRLHPPELCRLRRGSHRGLQPPPHRFGTT